MSYLRGVVTLFGGLLGAAVLSGCGPVEKTALPRPPVLPGDHPAIGRTFELEVLGPQDAPMALQGATGRVTLICLQGPLVGATGTPPPQPGPVAATCEEVARLSGDRVSVVGISTGSEPPAPASYRVFRDPGGAKLLAKLPLGAATEYLVLDRQRRVAAVIETGAEPRLHDVLRRLTN